MAVIFAKIRQLVVLVLLFAERLNLLDAAEVILQPTAQLAGDFLVAPEQRPDFAGEIPAGQQHKRHRNQREQRHGWVDDEEHHRHPNNNDDVADEIRHRMGDQQLQHAGVVGSAAHDLAGLLLPEIAHRQRLQLIVHPHGHITHELPRRHMRQIQAHKPEHRPQQIRTRQHRGIDADHLHRHGGGVFQRASQPPHHLRRDQAHHGGTDQSDHRRRHHAPIRARHFQQSFCQFHNNNPPDQWLPTALLSVARRAYSGRYNATASTTPPAISTTECCLINTVDRQIKIVRTRLVGSTKR